MDLSTLTLDELERHYTAEGDDEKAKLIRRCLDAVAAAKEDLSDREYDRGYDDGFAAGEREAAHG